MQISDISEKKKKTTHHLNYLTAICIKGPEAVQYKYGDTSYPKRT